MWIKTNFDFGMPIADFTLSVRRIQALNLRDAVAARQNQPEEIEKAVLEIVRFFRPSLADAAVIAIDCQPGLMQWTFTLMHPSLERVPPGTFPKRYDLTEGKITCRDGIEIDPPLVTEMQFREMYATVNEAIEKAGGIKPGCHVQLMNEEMTDPGAAVIDANGLSNQKSPLLHCCHIGCSKPATNEITTGRGVDDYTHICDNHVAEHTVEGDLVSPLLPTTRRDS